MKKSTENRREFSLSLKNIRLYKSVFEANASFQFPESGGIPINPKINVQLAPENENMIVRLSVHLAGNNLPFNFEVSYIGLFGLKGKDDLESNRVGFLNCAPILFPYLREHVADLTMRAGYPPYHMQPVNFVSLYEEGEKKQ